MLNNHLQHALHHCGLIAILRGVRPAEVEAIGKTLYEAGLRIIEVPLNSPEPLLSIAALRRCLPADCVVGAGTVLGPEQVSQVQAAGGELIVMPHSDPAIITATKAAGLYSAPGVATVTEAYAALAAGADVLKLFPAEQLGPAVLKAWRAVIPMSVTLLPVGGIATTSIAPFTSVGASGFGLGSALYQPGMNATTVGLNAKAFVAAWKACQQGSNQG